MKQWLSFQRPPGIHNNGLEWEVWENYRRPQGLFKRTARVGHAYSGRLGFSTGANEGWWFISSDDSININLGGNVRKAMKKLRAMYQGKNSVKRSTKRNGRRLSRKGNRRTR